MSNTEKGYKSDNVRAVARALDILLAFTPSDHELSPGELLKRVDLSRPTLYRLLYTLQELQREANAHLATQVAQGTAILCWLTTLADLSCRQLRVAEADAKVHQQMLAALQTLEGVEKLAHARELVEYEQHKALEDRIAACCPVATPAPGPCYQACAEPPIRRHDPRGQDWKPDFAARPGTPGRADPPGAPR